MHNEAYQFDEFLLDAGRGELSRQGASIALRPKTFDVLLHLVRYAGQLRSRQELIDAVWPNQIVSDDSLTQCLIEIRRALGDESRTIVITVPRRGYRFDAKVKSVNANPGHQESDHDLQKPGTHNPSRWTVGAIFILALAIAATWWRTGAEPEPSDYSTADWTPPPASIAVLPFVDMSERADQVYLAEGISEEILNSLAQSDELVVIARTSSFAYSGNNQDIRGIARQLNVSAILEGSVRKSGERVRVTAQLVDGKTGAHLWSDTYDDNLSDVFAMQDRISSAVAGVLLVELTDSAMVLTANPKPRPNPEAWEAYVQGRYFYNRRNDGDILRAQEYFQQATETDPGFADAWVGLAASIRLRGFSSEVEQQDRLSSELAITMMNKAYEQALALDPKQAEALWRSSMLNGLVLGLGETDSDKILSDFSTAISEGNNSAIVQALAGGFSLESQNLELSSAFLRRAVLLDPISLTHRYALAVVCYRKGELERAREILEEVFELHSIRQEVSVELLIDINIHQGELGSASRLLDELTPGPDKERAIAILAYLQGDIAGSDAAIEQLLNRPHEEAAAQLAMSYAMRGQTDEAFFWLAEATNVMKSYQLGRDPLGQAVELVYSPHFKPLHNDERWHTWSSSMENLGLNELALQVVQVLTSHVQAHPELYEQPVSGSR